MYAVTGLGDTNDFDATEAWVVKSTLTEHCGNVDNVGDRVVTPIRVQADHAHNLQIECDRSSDNASQVTDSNLTGKIFMRGNLHQTILSSV